MIDWTAILEHVPPYIIAIGSLIASIILIRKGNREVQSMDADTASKYQQMLAFEQNQSFKMLQDMTSMKEKIRVLEDKLEEVQEILEEYTAGIELLLAQLKTSGITPIWKPKAKKTPKE